MREEQVHVGLGILRARRVQRYFAEQAVLQRLAPCRFQESLKRWGCAGELEEGVLQELSEADARARLREALDTMLRMGLLEKEGAPQTAAAGPEQGSRGVVYVAQPSTTLELPAALSQGPPPFPNFYDALDAKLQQ